MAICDDMENILIMTSDKVPVGEVLMVSGWGRYSSYSPPRYVVERCDDGTILGFMDAAKVVGTGKIQEKEVGDDDL